MEKEINSNWEKIINYLYNLSTLSLFGSFIEKNLDPSLIKDIEEINELFPFIPLMFVKNKQISEIARQKVNKLLANIPITGLAGFDEKIRNFIYPNYSEVLSKYWYNLEPSVREKINCNNRVLIKILCCHPNGYVRFNAIRSLVKISIKEAIPFLILRANDWVDELRKFCHDTLIQVIGDKKGCSAILEYAPLVKQLKGKGRYDQIKLTQEIESALLTYCQDGLFNMLKSQDFITSRYAFSILSNSNYPIEKLLEATTSHQDIIIKLNAFNLAKTHYNSNQFLIYVSKLANDRFMLIRKKVLYEMIESYPEHAKDYLEMALLDRSHSIRSLGRYYLKQQGLQEFTHYYTNALNSQGVKPHLLLGLSEVGNKKDFASIRPLINKNIPGVQAAIISAAFKMKPEDWKNIIKNLIKNPDSSKLKALTSCLINAPESYSFSEIIDLIYKRENLLQLRYFLKIITRVNYEKWQILSFILEELIYYKEDETMLLIERYLDQWITRNSPNKNFMRLSEDAFIRIYNKLTKVIEKNSTRLIYKKLMKNILYFGPTFCRTEFDNNSFLDTK